MGVYRCLVALGAQFGDMGLFGLVDFGADLPPPPVLPCLRDLRFFVCCPGRDGACIGLCFPVIQHFDVLTWPVFDPVRRVRSGIYLAVGRARLRPVVVLCAVLFDLSWGPWRSCGWFGGLGVEAARYWEVAGARGPICLRVLSRIRRRGAGGSVAFGFGDVGSAFGNLCGSSF